MSEIKVGIQLYSIYFEMEKDMDKALGAVKDMGYDYVEFAGYFGKSAEEVRALLDKHSLECVSVHQKHSVFLTEPEESIDFIKKLGAKYCAIPWMPPALVTSKDGFETLVGEVSCISKLFADAGMQLLYHNHDFEFTKLGDSLVIDKLFRIFENGEINPEFDTCWLRYAGYDPVEYIEKYKGRCSVVHLKDFVCKKLGAGPRYALIDEKGNKIEPVSEQENEFHFCPLGKGLLDTPAIIDVCKRTGVEYLIVEQDQSDDIPPMEAIRQSREYLRELGY